MRVLCAGHVNWDVTLQVDRLPAPDAEARVTDRREGGGGSAANVAVALAELGVDSGVVGCVAEDRPGRRARRELREAGVETFVQTAAGETAVKYLAVEPDGEAVVFGTDGVNEAHDPGAVPEHAVERADWCHLTGQAPATAAALARRARAAGCTVSVAPGRRVERDFDEALALADVVFCNRRERGAVTPPEDAVVVTTRGGAGATVEADREYRHDGFDADAVDSTGAGDAFAAGFVSARLDGAGHDRALAVGNACGALVAEREGTRPGLDREAVADRCS